MAKFGPPDKAKYDPFSQISTALSALASPATEERDESRGVEERAAEPAARVAVVTPPSEPAHPAAQSPVRAPAAQHHQELAGPSGARPSGARNVPDAIALTTTKRFKTTQSEALKHDQAALRLGARLGISVDFSKLTRALWEIYLQNEDDILKQLQGVGGWKRPANNDPVGLAELDERLAEAIGEGLMVASMRPKNRPRQ